jgi:chromosome segregation ATPase
MTTGTPPPAGPRTLVLDRLFSHLAEEAAGRAVADGGDTCFYPPDGNPRKFAETEPPPPMESAADLRAAHEWLLRERERLDIYTRGQLLRTQREHQAFVQQTYLKEQALVLRTQELNRKEEMLVHQFGVLRQKAAAVEEQERKVAPYLEALRNAQAELEDLRRQSCALHADVKGQQALRERLRSEAESLEREREATRADLAAREAAFREEKRAVAARHARMDQRLQALDEAEAAAARRVAELDELEARLRREFREQEEELAQLRRVSAGLLQDTKGQRSLLQRIRVETESLAKARDTVQKHLAGQAAAIRAEKESLAARQAELKRRLQALEEAEAAFRRRASEPDELESRPHEDFKGRELPPNGMRQASQAADSRAVPA